MTPFEELQAAHSRLAELRDRERVVPGALIVTETTPGQLDVHEVWMANAFEKLDMLHRTFDAQIELLRLAEAEFEAWPTAKPWDWQQDVLALARAINGEAS